MKLDANHFQPPIINLTRINLARLERYLWLSYPHEIFHQNPADDLLAQLKDLLYVLDSSYKQPLAHLSRPLRAKLNISWYEDYARGGLTSGFERSFQSIATEKLPFYPTELRTGLFMEAFKASNLLEGCTMSYSREYCRFRITVYSSSDLRRLQGSLTTTLLHEKV